MECLSGEHYAKRLDLFRDKSGALAKNKTILNLHLPSVISQILQTSRGLLFNVLSVGSGDGAIDSEMLQILDTEIQRHDKYRDMKIFIRAIEPNHHHISLYKKAIENLPESLKCKTTFDVRAQTFQEYSQDNNQDSSVIKFHLAFFNHSIYYVDAEETLKHCFEKELGENGQVVVVVDGDEDLIGAVLAEMNPEISAVEVMDAILKNGWKYETFSQDYEIDVTEVFNEGSIEGNLLLDFMTKSVNFRVMADKEKVEKILSVVQRETVGRDGKRFGKKSDAVLTIRE